MFWKLVRGSPGVKEVQSELRLLACLGRMNDEDRCMKILPILISSLALNLLVGLQAPVSAADASSLPEVRVENVRRVFWNGEHNAFTDLIRWKDRYYLTFRSCPDGHMVFPSAKIIVLASDDTKSWEKVYEFSVPKRDTRDPHFLEFKGKLFVYSGTWYCGDSAPKRADYDMNKHLGYGVWTEDGKKWSIPEQLEGTYGHYIWRATAHDGKAYLCGRRRHDYADENGERGWIESAMLESDDGLRWRFAGLFQDKRGNETDFLFEPDGQVVALVRDTNSTLNRARPPYQKWERKNIGVYIGGPMFTRWGERFLIGGRKMDFDKEAEARKPKTVLYWLKKDDSLQQIAELPSGGDNSYTGFIELSPTKGLLSWYSSHEKDEKGKTITAIYLADLVIE